MEDAPKPAGTKREPLLYTAGAVVFTILIAGGAYYYAQSLKTAEPRDLTPDEEAAVWRPGDYIYSGTQKPDGPEDNDPRPKFGELLEKRKEQEQARKYDLEVAWLPRPVKASYESQPLSFHDYFTALYEVGTIKNGVFAGMKVYLLYESGMASEYGSLYTFNAQTAVNVQEWIPEMVNLPASITDKNTGLRLTKDPYVLGAALLDLEAMAAREGVAIEKFVPNTDVPVPGGVLYRYKDCFFVRTPSDLLVEYTVDIPFVLDESEGGYGTPNISFTQNNGLKARGEYNIYGIIGYGCGSLCSPLNIVDRDDTDFAHVGTTDSGQVLYALKNTQDVMLKELYNQPNTRAFVDTSGGQYQPLETNKYSYEQFLSMNPILFWKDQLGRWAEFVHSEFLILAEKCKPVIYLYPEQETKLHVEVAPNVGFTKTIPEYGDGWDVVAYPDGTIIDDATGEKYDYLYWTGWVDGYPLIERGWVVAQKDLPAFFDVYLAKYGLVGREIGDFKEYWEEDLDDAPYYAVSFVDQAAIDELSPLSVDVKPDVVIRVLMTAMPLERPIELEAPYVPPAPVRHGFTVAEWGGTILRAR